MYLSELTKEEQEAVLRRLYDQCSRYLEIWNVEETVQEDILQITMVRVLDRFSTLRNPEKLLHWVRTVLKNEVYQYYRKIQREMKYRLWTGENANYSRGVLLQSEPVISPQETFKDSELYGMVRSLGQPNSTIILRNAVYGETLAEIAGTLYMNPSTVRSIAARSVRRLRTMILKDSDLADRYRTYIEEWKNSIL